MEFDLSGVVGEAVTEAQLAEMQAAEVDEWGAALRAAIDRAGPEGLEFEAISESAWRCNSFERMPFLVDVWWLCERGAWLKALGECWSRCDNVSQYRDELAEALGGEPLPVAQMMDAAELEAYEALPEEFTVYRGCYAENKWGMCWSTSKEVAERFPFLNRYRQSGQPLLIRATLKKSQVLAVKLDRDEFEVITLGRPKCLAISTAKNRTGD